jgi:hypothetical protein
MTGAGNRAPFDPRLMIAVVLVGVVGFIAMWALIALGPQMSAQGNGRGHALSKSVAGYAGIIDLAERSDMWVDVRRELVEATPLGEDEGRTLLVLTPEHDSDPADIAELIEAHGQEPVLLVLPKWETGPHQEQKGWAGSAMLRVASAALFSKADLGGGIGAPRIQSIAAPTALALTGSGYRRGTVTLAPGQWQRVAPGALNQALLALPGRDEALLLRGANRRVFVLTDPDLINNFAFASRDGARAALAILDAVAEDADADGVAFDVTLNGLGSGGSGFLRLAFVPPFIGITLCLIAAGLLALWQAAVRFGPALVPARAIAISKRALIESSAELVAQTQRESDAAVPWLRGQREALARALHAPPALSGEALDDWIDRRRRAPEGEGFAALARRLLRARTNDELLGTARAIHAIRKELLREH